MTGFAKENGELVFDDLGYNWSFELKSVNGKGLDLKVKSPAWLGDISIGLKSILGRHFQRGSFSVYLDVSSTNATAKVKINEELLEQLMHRAISLSESHMETMSKATAGELLAIKGVVEVEESNLDEESLDALQKTLFDSFEKVCKSLAKSRSAEGLKIKDVLVNILTKVENVVAEVEKKADKIPVMLKEKLLEQVKSLSDGSINISEERIAQEVVLYVAKADIKEEIDRLQAHLKTAHELLGLKEPVGRKLDFLCQELNREANTTCSKSVDLEITNWGMELKTLIEQFREQVQNVE